jgi:tetratricopeptide (TPR) repeat protein
MNKNSVLEQNPDNGCDEDAGQQNCPAIGNFANELLAVFNYIPLGEDSAKHLYGFGYALYQQSRFAEAAEAFLYLLMYSKPDGKVLMAMGACCQAQSDFENAMRFYQACIDNDYSHLFARFHLGECLARLNKKFEALEQFRLVAEQTSNLENYAELHTKATGMKELAEKFEDFSI